MVPPPPGFIKINFDGSLLNSSAAGGYVLRDWTGKLLKVGVANYGHTSITVAEARALKDGASVAIQAGYRRLLIEGDNTIVIQALAGNIQVPWKIATITEDFHLWVKRDTLFRVQHIFREAKIAADWQSKFEHIITNSISSDIYFSSTIGDILTTDLVGHTLVRRGV